MSGDPTENGKALLAGLESLAVVASDQASHRRSRRVHSEPPPKPIEGDNSDPAFRPARDRASSGTHPGADAARVGALTLATHGELHTGYSLTCVGPDD